MWLVCHSYMGIQRVCFHGQTQQRLEAELLSKDEHVSSFKSCSSTFKPRKHFNTQLRSFLMPRLQFQSSEAGKYQEHDLRRRSAGCPTSAAKLAAR